MDGCPNLTVGLLKLMKDQVKAANPEQEFFFLHCIIHQEVLSKTVLKLTHVVDTVTKVVNFIRGKALNHRQFVTLLEESESEYTDLPYHSNVRWISLGKVLKRVRDLKSEIDAFLETKVRDGDFPQLKDADWLADFAFAVDVMGFMNELNCKLQGKCQFAHEMYSLVKAFMTKLLLFSYQLESGNIAHLPTLQQQSPPADKRERYATLLRALHGEFLHRFEDFRRLENEMALVSSPFICSVDTTTDDLQLELIDLQSDALLAEQFKTVPLPQFYAFLNAQTFPRFRAHAQKMLVLFETTYIHSPKGLLGTPVQFLINAII
ncbi:general transcription factor II-I repeat domain-containing protein 2A-like [Amia ocellicauda]|uniref:general transcription factor II-I repeat domain-containing protein 2A-like n=1 Tax=Amia ocellicauda TaxID=2972642 RepID=UPI0034643C70